MALLFAACLIIGIGEGRGACLMTCAIHIASAEVEGQMALQK